jgi:hypothetical protein
LAGAGIDNTDVGDASRAIEWHDPKALLKRALEGDRLRFGDHDTAISLQVEIDVVALPRHALGGLRKDQKKAEECRHERSQ